MNLGATLVASFLVTLVRPATWPLALATFLLRGGLLLVIAPIVVIPSPIGLANMIGPAITSFVFGGVSTWLLVLIVGAALVGLVWLVGGGLMAAAAEAEAVGLVASDEDVAGSPRSVVPDDRDLAPRILAARLLAHVPTAGALAWGLATIVSVTYRELTVPSDVTTPIGLRVIGGAPEAIGVIAATWILGQIVGALAARRLVLAGDGVAAALVGAGLRSVRHPLRVITFEAVPLLALVVALVPSFAAAATALDVVRASLRGEAGPIPTLASVALLVLIWLGGLTLAAVVSAWRAAVWTVDSTGTFGAPGDGREGDWNDAPPSGTLADLRSRGVDPETR